MLTQDAVSLMGLTFLCNRLVEGLYRLRQGNLTEKLKKVCEEAILEFDSLNWPYNKFDTSPARAKIFNTNLLVETLESFWKDVYHRDIEEKDLDVLIDDLQLVTSDAPIYRKLETAGKLQKFFDDLGDCSFYAEREHQRSIVA